MRFRLNNRYIKWGMTAFFVLAGAITFYYLIFHASNWFAGLGTLFDILLPVILGLITAYLLSPIMNFIEYRILRKVCKLLKIKRSKGRDNLIRLLSILAACVLFFAFVYIMIALLLSQIIPSIQNIIGNFDTYINNIYAWVNSLMVEYPEVGEWVILQLERYSSELERFLNETVLVKTSEIIKTVSLSIIGVLSALWDFLIGFIISIYLMSGKEKYAGIAKKIVYAVFERETANVFVSNVRFVNNTFIGFVGGKLVDSLIIGILCWIGTTWMNTPYAALISLIIGVTNVIPFFGPFLGAIPCTILIFVVDPMHPLNAVYFMVFVFLLQQLDGNFIGPKILGSSTGLESFWVIFSITLFGGLWGVPGMIIGVPLFAVIYAAVRSVVNNSLRKKNLQEDTEAYISVDHIDDEGNYEKFVPNHLQTVKDVKQKKKNRAENDKFLTNKESFRLLKKQQKEQKISESTENKEQE